MALPLFSKASPDPQIVAAMDQAYAKACKMLHDRGQPSIVQEIIAGRIVGIVQAGERDPDRICARVLKDVGIRPD